MFKTNVLICQAERRRTRFGLHGVRHLFESEYLDAGASLVQARDQMGHATIDMTNRYAHVVNDGREHVETVGRAFSCVSNLLSERTGERAAGRSEHCRVTS